LDDMNDTVRATAADALGKIGAAESEVIHALLAVLKEGEYYSSKTAAFALARFGHAALPALVEAMGYKGRGSHWVFGAIGCVVDPQAVSELLDLAQRGVTSAIEALGKIGPAAEEAVPFLIATVERRKEHVEDGRGFTISGSPRANAWMAAEALGAIGDRRATIVLVDMLKDGNQGCRSYAADALGKIGDRSAISALEQLQQNLNEPEQIRETAREAIALIMAASVRQE
jgi:HEAT repeat protein